MKISKKVALTIMAMFAALLIGSSLFFAATPAGRTIFNKWKYSLEKADETQYKTQKQVEDTCRVMIASYKSDKLIYEQYIGSDVSSEERSWANNAKIRANQTTNTYNEYILKNSFVWKENVPDDIYMELAFIT